VLLVFSMQLADTSGVEIERFDSEQWLAIPTSGTAVYPFGAAWTAPLDRATIMTVNADVYDSRGDSFGVTGDALAVSLACTVTGTGGDAPVGVCKHASRWWRRHAAEWPVSSLTLGGVTYDAAQVMGMLRSWHCGMVDRRLAHQLAVAKLNLANGVANDIGATVAAADAWLAAHPQAVRGRRHEPRQEARREALGLIRELRAWNRGGCPDGSNATGDDDDATDKSGLAFADNGAEYTGDFADYDSEDKAAVENTSLGTLKAMFR
jgi:hypothetical protein